MTDHTTETADKAKTLTVHFLRQMVEGSRPSDRAALLTGALYAIAGVSAHFRPRDMSPEEFRSMMTGSLNSALTQSLPGSPVAMTREATSEEGFQVLLADMACRTVQDLAAGMIERAVGAPWDPTNGVVTGTIAGAAHFAASSRDLVLYPEAKDLEPVVLDLMRTAWAEHAVHEAADAMGKVQGHG